MMHTKSYSSKAKIKEHYDIKVMQTTNSKTDTIDQVVKTCCTPKVLFNSVKDSYLPLS